MSRANNSISEELRHDGPLTYRIRWYYDENPDTSWLGEPTDKPDWSGTVYDRWTEWLWVGAGQRWYDKASARSDKQGGTASEDGQSLTDDEYTEKLGENASGNRREYRYFHSFQNLADTADDRRACFADAERLTGYYADLWYMQGCEVVLFANNGEKSRAKGGDPGEELALDSLWGIESDAGDDYEEEIVVERMAQCREQALDDLPDTIAKLAERAARVAKVMKALQEAVAKDHQPKPAETT